jgi:hypothetical protein
MPIAHPAGEPEPDRLLFHEGTVADPLDAAFDAQVDGADVLANELLLPGEAGQSAAFSAVTSISISILSSTRPVTMTVQAGRTSPKYFCSTGQMGSKSSLRVKR